MKVLLSFALLMISTTVFGQTAPGKLLNKITEDSPVSVTYHKSKDSTKANNVKYYFNGVYYGTSVPIFSPVNIESINVVDKESKVLITFDKSYQPKLLTLGELKKKYVKTSNKKAIYIVDGNFFDHEAQMIDERYVLNIKIQDSNDLDIVTVTLKTKSNLEKANTIHIRGNNPLGK